MFMADEPLDDFARALLRRFRPARIVLAKRRNRTEGRRRSAEKICAPYPEAEAVKAFDTPHHRVDLGESDPLRLYQHGKQTLVLGEHRGSDWIPVGSWLQ